MRLHVLTISGKVPAWVKLAWNDYAQRLPRSWPLHLQEIRPAARDTGKTVAQWQNDESERLWAAAPTGSQVIALDEHGLDWNSQTLSQQLVLLEQECRDLSFLIGGPDGLSDVVLQRCHRRVRLSSLTFPHAMVRIIVAEQLYRAWTLTTNHPYHRD